MKNAFIALATLTVAASSAWAANTADSRAIAIANTHFANGSLASVDLSLEPIYCATGTLYAAFADADMGDNLADWPNVVASVPVTEENTLVNCVMPAAWGSAGYKFVRFFLVSSVLKDGDYGARLEYVDSSTSSDVDTGVVPTASSRVEAGIMRTIDAAQIAVHGTGGTGFSTWIGSQNNLSCRFLGRAAWPNMQTKDLWYYFTQSSANYSYVDGNGNTKTVSYDSASTVNPTTSIHLFNNGTDTTYCKQLRLAYWRHFKNDVLVSSYVPVLLSDGVTVDLWDIVNGRAANCPGLTAGPVVGFGASFTNATPAAISHADTIASTVSSREIAVADVHITNGKISSVDVSLAPMLHARGTLYAAFAGADMGDSLSDWPNVAEIAPVTEADTIVNYTLPAAWGTAGYKFLRLFLVSSALKDGGYARRLEYVDSSSSSDVDTGLHATPLSRIESAFMRVENYAQVVLYGGGDTDSGKHLTGWLGTQSNVPWRFAGVSATPNLLSANLWYYASQGYHAVPDRTSLVVTDGNGTVKTNHYANVSSSWVSTDTMHIFRNGLNTNNEQYRLPVRMAYWRHYTNDVLAASYVPALPLGDSTPGLFETVSGTFIPCAGLTAGPAAACVPPFTNAAPEVVEYEELGASELNPAISVDTARQRLFGFSGSLSVIGAPPTYVLLKQDGETKASAVAAADGTWSLEWDATADVPWSAASVGYEIVCSNEVGAAVYTSSVQGSFTPVDNATYTWKGGAAGNWSDAANWTSSLADSRGYPRDTGTSAVIPDNTTAEIALDADVDIADFAVGASNANVTVAATSPHAFTARNYFLSSLADDGVKGSTFVFSGPIAVTNLMAVGMGSTLRLENGVRAYSLHGLKLCNNEIQRAYDSVFEIRSGSEATFGNGLNSDNSMMNADTKIVVDDATLVLGFLIMNVNVPGGTVWIGGNHPEMRVFLTLRSQTGTTTGTGKFVFSIPVGGFGDSDNDTPFRFTGNISDSFGGNAPILWTLDRESPAFKTGPSSGSTRLLFSRLQNSDIDTVHNEFVVPSWLSECKYTIDNEASPKTVSVSWTARRGMIIFFR